jgi:hypothetical protein
VSAAVERPLGLIILPIALTLMLSAADLSSREYFPISAVKDYPHPEKALAALVRRDGKAPFNHFCIVGIRAEGDYFAEVFWRENNTLTLWETGDPDDVESLLLSRRVWNLKKDVVPSQKDIGFSTYLITQQEVDQTLAACNKTGKQFTIRRTQKQ